MTNPDDQSRAAFEAWYCSVFRFGHLERFKHPQYDGDPLPYKLLSCNTAWLGWQAAIEHVWRKPTPEPHCECHERDGSYVCEYCRSQGLQGHMEKNS